MTIASKDFGGNNQLEKKTDSFKESNSKENYELVHAMECILIELKEITKQLNKINS